MARHKRIPSWFLLALPPVLLACSEGPESVAEEEKNRTERATSRPAPDSDSVSAGGSHPSDEEEEASDAEVDSEADGELADTGTDSEAQGTDSEPADSEPSDSEGMEGVPEAELADPELEVSPEEEAGLAEARFGIEDEQFLVSPDIELSPETNGPIGISVSVGTAPTAVWEVKNQWEDTETEAARASGMAWEADSGLSWDEKYATWVRSMRRTEPFGGGSRDTFELLTPWGKTAPAPKLECAETAMFLRVAFASWYELPFFMTAATGSGTRIYFGHFGARTGGGRYANTPYYKNWYQDYRRNFAGASNDTVLDEWPEDPILRTRGLYGGGDEMDYPFEDAPVGAYFDEIFLNKRVGYFLTLLLTQFGSMHLADPRNTFDLAPRAMREGDFLLHRHAYDGIGHTLVVKLVTPLDGGRRDVEVVSGSMPRRQPLWDSPLSSKMYFVSDYAGGPDYVEFGGGLKRWSVPKNVQGVWTNTWTSEDAPDRIPSSDRTALAARPQEFRAELGTPTNDELRDGYLSMVQTAREHLSSYPASCAARTRREEAFAELYALMQTEFGMSRTEVDQEYRLLEDYVFAELEYEQSKTCCWNSTTPEMYQIIMDYSEEMQSVSCVTPQVFKATNGDYDVFRQFAIQTGRGDQWREWSEDETCPQRDSEDDPLAGNVTEWCSRGGSDTTAPAPLPSGPCVGDDYEPNDSSSRAQPLPSGGTFEGLTSCGDDDYFTVDPGLWPYTSLQITSSAPITVELYDEGELIDAQTGPSIAMASWGWSEYTVRVLGGVDASYDIDL